MIKATDQVTDINGVPVRLWEGTTANGIACKVFVHRVSVQNDADCSAFEAELKEQMPPGLRTIPLWMIS
jgi:hypothetical protein